MKGGDEVDTIFIDRLLRLYDPHQAWGMRFDRDAVLAAAPISEWVADHSGLRNTEWHKGRTRYFYDRIVRRNRIDPIEIDNHWDGNIPSVIVVDGHHRLLAAIFARKKTIPARYSGWVKFLDYLTGITDLEPEP